MQKHFGPLLNCLLIGAAIGLIYSGYLAMFGLLKFHGDWALFPAWGAFLGFLLGLVVDIAKGPTLKDPHG